ncbi:hypothetical protein AtNW77_Chr4g0309821 [Arabidopsis thaliana]|jgi:hypothetical protein
MFGFFFQSLEKYQVTHGLKRSLDKDLRFEVTKTKNWIGLCLVDGKWYPRLQTLVFGLRIETEH